MLIHDQESVLSLPDHRNQRESSGQYFKHSSQHVSAATSTVTVKFNLLTPSNLETFHISVLPLQILTVMLFCTHLSVSHVCHFSLHFLSSISAFSTSGSELYSSSAALSGGDVGCAQHCVCLHVSCWVHPCSAHVPAGVHICKQYTVHATHVAVCVFVCRGCDPRAWWWWELYLGGERTTFLLGLPASREWQMKQKNRITCTDISPELESGHKGGWRKE